MRSLFLLLVCISCGVAESSAEVTADGDKLTARTKTVEAVFDAGRLVSVRQPGKATEFIASQPADPGADLLFLNGQRLGQDKKQAISLTQLSPIAARYTIDGADSRRTLLITTDASTGDVCVTASGLANRRGVRAVDWRVAIAPEASVVLPVVNGLEVRTGQAHPASGRFPWPFKWEAQLVIAQRDDMAMMIHSQDRLMRFKALQLDRHDDRTELGFQSEPTGPLWDNRTAGGIEWRLNLYPGDWTAPAERYRGWMADAYDLEQKKTGRPAWVDRITLAVCWAPASVNLLDAMAKVHPPEQTLIHLSSGWRGDAYDVNYPDYTPIEAGLKYMEHARELGFHVMPHFNFWAVHEINPFYHEVSDFQIRSVDQNKPEGWYWPPETHSHTRLAYIHPGLGLWRDKLMGEVLSTCDKMGTEAAFIDQTLCTWNTDNGHVEGMSTVTGLHQLHEEYAAVRPDLVLVGEGLNEVSFQRQAFAQAHIHDGWGKLEQRHVDAAHPICAFLWSGHTRLIGYYHLNPDNEDFKLGIEVYERMNAVPTLITGKPEHLENPAAGTKRILERAGKLSADLR